MPIDLSVENFLQYLCAMDTPEQIVDWCESYAQLRRQGVSAVDASIITRDYIDECKANIVAKEKEASE